MAKTFACYLSCNTVSYADQISSEGFRSGGAHDLSDNVPAGVELIVLTVQGYSGE